MVKRLQQNLGVARAAKLHAITLKVSAEITEIVDLAVVDEDTGTICRNHRLSGCFAKIEDGEAPVAESNAALLPNASAVGSTVYDGSEHRVDCRSVCVATIMSPDTNQSAHLITPYSLPATETTILAPRAALTRAGRSWS
jgi:hypothetical protein